MGHTSAPRRRVAVLSTATRRWSRRGREVLLGKQDLPNSATAPPFKLVKPGLFLLPQQIAIKRRCWIGRREKLWSCYEAFNKSLNIELRPAGGWSNGVDLRNSKGERGT